jgi:hypothetical protein
MPHKVQNLESPESLTEEITAWGIERGLLAPGDRVVYVTGTGLLNNTHNLLVVHEVPSSK